ncbi:MAG: cyclic nucleotide-binding domain-containing protein [Deltaproteobacteria bacterium]|jgi:CRP/FNR family cyclic AMP-dependent transcriptional regulator|nr:cyclic nucleotide-binding domain-containing protein [Deltaproteobacteria bacterium]
MNSYTENRQLPESSEFQQNLELLRQMDFFSVLSLEALKVFAYLFTREKFSPGEDLFQQDDNDGKAFFIISGTADVVREDERGEAILGKFAEGEFFGGLALLGDMRRLFSVRAQEDMMCLVMTREKFTKALEQFPELMPRVLQATVKGIRLWEKRLLLEPGGLCNQCRKKVGVSLI